MLETIIYIGIGALIGWNFPQPFWAKVLQNKVVGYFKK
jgi:hypothetical protein